MSNEWWERRVVFIFSYFIQVSRIWMVCKQRYEIRWDVFHARYAFESQHAKRRKCISTVCISGWRLVCQGWNESEASDKQMYQYNREKETENKNILQDELYLILRQNLRFETLVIPFRIYNSCFNANYSNVSPTKTANFFCLIRTEMCPEKFRI